MNTFSSFRFSFNSRNEAIENIHTEFDLLIVGGGITGAGIALDAASRGLKVILVEKHDYAWGTSSRSTKLIHGGLRYLKQLELQLVKEVGTERAIVHKNARNIVIPEKMLLPIYKKGSLGKYSTSLALYVYDYLAGVKAKERRKMLSKEETKKSEPLLKTSELIGGGLYYEYRSDDARLTIELIKKAVSIGVVCINYAEFVKPIYENNVLAGGEIEDKLSEKHFEIKAKKIVNACGPWVDLLRKKDNSLKGKRLQLTKGVHIVCAYNKLPLKQAVYFDVNDGRMIFAIPRDGKTYIGTTDTIYNKDIDIPKTELEDVQYLIKAVNNQFSKVKLELKDIESSWVGLRPLIYEDGKAPGELSRKDEIFVSETGLISIAGGKLTGYRKMAERVVDKVLIELQKELKPCLTENIQAYGSAFNSSKEINDLIIELTSENKNYHITSKRIKEWVSKYGTETKHIIEKYKTLLLNNTDYDLCFVLAELDYCIEKESVLKLEDFYIRRSARVYFDAPNVKKYLEDASTYLMKKLDYSDSEMKKQKETVLFYLKLSTEFKN